MLEGVQPGLRVLRGLGGLLHQEGHHRLHLHLPGVLRFSYRLPIIVHITDYHWDRHLYFVIHSYHAQTMTHTPPSDDSILVLRLVVLGACDSD
jgi:PII-like signaling protein